MDLTANDFLPSQPCTAWVEVSSGVESRHAAWTNQPVGPRSSPLDSRLKKGKHVSRVSVRPAHFDFMKYRKKPVVIEATQWFKNGDHPEDYTAERSWTENGETTMKPGSFFKEHDYEGGIVRYFRHPQVHGDYVCHQCAHKMNDHGFIDSLEGGHTVCVGDWIITGVKNERYACKPDIFTATYEHV